jgi:ABC-type glycerol-3-phosphate transport system substrate-binding protein
MAALLAACDGGDSDEAGELVAGFPDWILRLHPAIEGAVGPAFSESHAVEVTQRRGASVNQLALDAADKRSEWDVFVGVTPFVEMASLVESGALEPWNPYVPPAVVDDLHPALRREGTYDGKLYAWPFLVDVTVQGWNVDLIERAGLDPGLPPRTWDEYVENARTVQRVGAAPYGCTFDPRGWRSLVPITYTFDTDVYTEDGLFDYTHDAVTPALELMRRMYELANPDVLDPHTTAGSGATTDEGAFASQLVGYYVKYANAPVRAANTWPDPSRLALSSVPTPEGREGAVLFWTTAIALARFGGNERSAAAYAEALTYDRALWRDSIGTGRQASGQLPPYRSLWAEWRVDQAAWMSDWAGKAFAQLRNGVTIRPHRLGSRQFTIGQPYLEPYLTGDETNARRALRSAMAAVRKAAA